MGLELIEPVLCVAWLGLACPSATGARPLMIFINEAGYIVKQSAEFMHCGCQLVASSFPAAPVGQFLAMFRGVVSMEGRDLFPAG